MTSPAAAPAPASLSSSSSGPMPRVLITGATGFLGRAIVALAARSLSRVRATARRVPESPLPPKVDFVPADLTDAPAAAAALDGIDTVIHAAASAIGREPWSGTIEMTATLLAAMKDATVRRLILISSLAVIDFAALSERDVVTESSPMERFPERRDGYARAKIRQEQLAREWAARHDGHSLTILRPGAVVDRDHVWTPRLGVRIDRNHWLQIGRDAALPLVHVSSVAAITRAVLASPGPPPIVHAIDPAPPAQQTYIDALVAAGLLPRPRAVVPRGAIKCVMPLRHLLPRRHRPSLLTPASFAARFKPLTFDTTRAATLAADAADARSAVSGFATRLSLRR